MGGTIAPILCCTSIVPVVANPDTATVLLVHISALYLVQLEVSFQSRKQGQDRISSPWDILKVDKKFSRGWFM